MDKRSDELSSVKKSFEKKNFFLIIGIVILMIVLIAVVFFNFSNQESFSSNVFLLKSNLFVGGESISNIEITNNKNKEQTFKISLMGYDNVASLNEQEFNLNSKESKEIQIHFKDTGLKQDLYLGNLIIESNFLKKEIPVMISIEDPNRVFTILYEEIPEYRNVYPGGVFGINIKVFDVKDNSLKEAKITHYIKNFENEVVLLEKEKPFLIDGKYSFLKVMDIPPDFPYGNYVFVTEIQDGDTKTTIAYLFKVSKKEDDSLGFKLFMIIAILFVIGILILFFYFIKTKDNLLIQLKNQQKQELNKHLLLIKNSEEEIKKLKNLPEKKAKTIVLVKTKKEIIHHIQSNQKKQRIQLKSLKKQGKRDLMREKLKNWKKQGYDLLNTKNELKKISKPYMGKELKTLKRKGYNTDFLKK